jgi:predicted AAA+ superfamily ATPase
MIKRFSETKVIELLQGFPCVAIVGSRQTGKTTLAKEIRKRYKSSLYLDMELSKDFRKLDDAETYLQQFSDRLVIIDEVQRRKELFPVLRALIDQKRIPGRFLLLGSASPDLLRDSSETLAGRIAYHELPPLILAELPDKFETNDLWMYGGYPDAFLNKNYWLTWMNNYVRTYFERDLPNLGFPGDSLTGERLWSMLAHYHGNIVNYAELGRSMELSINTIKSYISFLQHAFLIRIIEPFHINLKKRLVKSPKVYIRDSGILHYLSGIDDYQQVIGHPKMGASWEGFVIEQIIPGFRPNRGIYFYRTHDGAELDLVITKGNKTLASLEIKHGSDAKPTRGNTEAVQTLNTSANFIIIKDDEDYLLSSGFRVCGIKIFLSRYQKEI